MIISYYHLYRFIYPQKKYHDNILCGMTTWSAAVVMIKVVSLNWKYIFFKFKFGWCKFSLYSLVGLRKLLHNISTTYRNLFVAIGWWKTLLITQSNLHPSTWLTYLWHWVICLKLTATVKQVLIYCFEKTF